MAESITVTDNRNGDQLEIPIELGGVSAAEWQKLLPGIWFYDPGFTATAACEISITFVDGDGGHPAVPRLPDRAAGGEVHLPGGRLPAAPRRAAERASSSSSGATTSRTTRSSTRTCASGSWRASTTTPTRWGCSSRRWRRCPRSTRTRRTSSIPESRSSQTIRLIAKMPTLAAAAHRFSVGMPFVYPDNSLDFSANFLSMMWKVAEPRFEADPDPRRRALEVLFILHADHEQNCSTTAMRVVRLFARRPVLGDRGGERRAVRAAPRRRERGR